MPRLSPPKRSVITRASARKPKIRELRQEIADIERVVGIVPASELFNGTIAATTRSKRKPMAAAQRKEVGARMKKYWAARGKAEKA